MDRQTLTLNIVVAKLTNTSFIAVCEVGGATIRTNRRAPDAITAAQDLLAQLAAPNGEASIALDLAFSGVSVADLAQLSSGKS